MALVDLFSLAAEEGIEIDFVKMSKLKCVAFPEGWIAIDDSKINGSKELKTTLAHELGHFATNTFYNINTHHLDKARCEYRANKWAIEKLIPLAELKIAIKQGLTEIWELSEHFDVPCEFVVKAIEYYKLKGDMP